MNYTIFSKRKSNGGYGAFTMGYSQIDGRDALITGARGAFIFDHSFAIGIGGYGFVNNLDYNSYHHQNPENELMLAGGYGGIFIEPIIAGTKPVHLSFPILIGMGGVALVDNYGWGWDWDWLGLGLGLRLGARTGIQVRGLAPAAARVRLTAARALSKFAS